MGVVIVAGGATGIGRAAVRAFRSQGDSVLLVDHNRAQAEEAAAEALEGPIELVHRDLTDPAAPLDIVDNAIAAFGSLDTVFVTAAILQSAPLAD